ncbi:hypothetical protein ABEB36_005118 [Hypothenemus hampei]|uniref:Probable Ufm1-specific protease 2 n=1 Tax=Hypothenemus hampei TaxID=57062 RepID=A0ABD1EXH5_HYPHA
MMKPQVKVLDTVIQRLKSLDNPCFGKLFGIFGKNTHIILGLQLNNEPEDNDLYALPAEIDFCGFFEAFGETRNTQEVLKQCSSIEVTDNPIFLQVKLTIQNDIQCSVICNNQINNTSYSLVSIQEVYTQFVHLRLQGDLQITSEQNKQSVSDSFATLRKTIASGVMAFIFPKRNIILVTSDSESGIVGLTGDASFGEICQDANIEGGSKKKKQNQTLELEIVDINLIKKVTNDPLSGEIKGHSPVVVVNKKQLDFLAIPIRVDFLATINKDTQLSKIYDILIESAIKYLRLYENVLQKYLERYKIESSANIPETLHFFPKDCGHFLTRIVFSNTDDVMKKEREQLHKLLLLNMTTPVFRKTLQYQFVKAERLNGPLRNVHEGIKPTNNDGKVCLVRGDYEYYHYCQNKMDDNGWGCAYRSLQTLASWYTLQGYVDREVPTFKEIQTCLVSIGDKPNTFINSRQWIGSTEVNYVLNSLLGITCKILYVSSGEEMSTKGPELVNHFETQGSPIMIGGGVLAHTILGVDYNQQTGNLKFLILDPHYTGDENLNVIQNKGWCGWKSVEFWDKTAYYNMCLPQVPKGI